MLSLISILLLRRAAVSWGYSTSSDSLALLFLIFSPAQFIYSQLVMSEIVFQFMLVMMILFLLKYLERERFSDLALYSVFMFLAALTKPVMYLFRHPVLLFPRLGEPPEENVPLVLTSLIPLVLIFGYCSWNAERTGRFAFSSIQSTNLVNHNTDFFPDGRRTGPVTPGMSSTVSTMPPTGCTITATGWMS